MRITAAIFLCIVAIAAWSCGDNTRSTPKGYEFKVITTGDGKTVKPGEILIIDMAIVDQNDSAWYDNRPTDYPEMIRISDRSRMESERGISEVFRMLSKGDSISFSMRAKDIFMLMWKMDVPEFVDPASDFTYRIKVRDILDEPGAIRFTHERDSIHNEKEKVRLAREEEEKKQAEAQLEEYNKLQLGKDTVLIDNYLAGKNVKANKLSSGMRYIIKTKGEGPTPADGDIVNIKFTGQLLDGKEFDSGEFSFALGKGDGIKGWDLIAKSMRKGTNLTVFVPSTLAYGQAGKSPMIGPDAIVVYDMELISFKGQ